MGCRVAGLFDQITVVILVFQHPMRTSGACVLRRVSHVAPQLPCCDTAPLQASLIVDKESEDTPMLETLLYALMTAAQRHARVVAPYAHMTVGPILQATL